MDGVGVDRTGPLGLEVVGSVLEFLPGPDDVLEQDDIPALDLIANILGVAVIEPQVAFQIEVLESPA